MILAVETAQFVLQRGSDDVDDLILNLTGATILYLVLKAPLFRKTIDRLTLC